jgi:hypothetical protein
MHFLPGPFHKGDSPPLLPAALTGQRQQRPEKRLSGFFLRCGKATLGDKVTKPAETAFQAVKLGYAPDLVPLNK